MEDRSVVLLDGGHPIDKVYHTQHQVLRSGFVWVLPGDRLQDCRESRRAASGAVLYRGGGAGKAGKFLTSKGIVHGGARPTVRKHGMDRYQNRARLGASPGGLAASSRNPPSGKTAQDQERSVVLHYICAHVPGGSYSFTV